MVVNDHDKLEQPPKALYVHVPFCVAKCRYCDFISFPYHKMDAARYVAGLRREIALRTKQIDAKRWALSTVFIGGGTPSCLSSDLLLEIITLIKESFALEPGCEVTMEANPGTVDEDKLYILRQAGVNRLSLGAQSCSADNLTMLGRIHTHEQTVEVFQHARAAGFDNINLDLIYGIPGQSVSQWEQCLKQILKLRPEHVAAYCLQIEEGTALAAMVERGEIAPCDEDNQAQMYGTAMSMLPRNGMSQYEISNYARPGRECRHNLVYWHNGQYLGLGPAAHSHLGNARIANAQDLDQYLNLLESGSLPEMWREEITLPVEIFETVFLGLRLTSGLSLQRFARRFGADLEHFYPGIARRLIDDGLLCRYGNNLRLTSRGLYLANRVMAEFVCPINY